MAGQIVHKLPKALRASVMCASVYVSLRKCVLSLFIVVICKLIHICLFVPLFMFVCPCRTRQRGITWNVPAALCTQHCGLPTEAASNPSNI